MRPENSREETMPKLFDTRSRSRLTSGTLLVLSTLVLFLSLGSLMTAQAQVPAEQPSVVGPTPDTKGAPDPFVSINRDFVRRYKRLLDTTKSPSNPIVLQCGSSLVLLKNGTESKVNILSHRYRVLEALSHIPVLIYVTLQPLVGRTMSSSDLKELEDARALIQTANGSGMKEELDPEQRNRGDRIVRNALAFIEEAMNQREVSEASLLGFVRAQSDDIEANLRDAAKEQITAMDAQMKVWFAALTATERARLSVVVCTPHMARVGNISMQYMAADLDNRFEGACQREVIRASGNWQLIYADTFDREGALTLLAEHNLDTQLGMAVFDDPLRMHRDVLGDGATGLIAKAIPEAKLVPSSKSCESSALAPR
jgi:hypothetical protein